MALGGRTSAPATLWALPTARLFSIWFLPPPVCETCITESDTTVWTLSTHHLNLYHSYLGTADGQAADLSGSLPAQATNDCVCRACGVITPFGHWTRWCPIPLIVAHAILEPSYQHSSLNSIALIDPRNSNLHSHLG